MKKKKLSLNKNVIAKLQREKMNAIIGGAPETHLTCMLGCFDNISIIMCEISSPCFNTEGPKCHYR